MLILLPNINTMHGKSLAIEEKNYVEFTTGISVLRSSSSEPKQMVGSVRLYVLYMLLFGHEGSAWAIRPIWLSCTQHLSISIDGQVSRWTRKYMIRNVQKTKSNSDISLYFSKSLEFLIVWGNSPRRPSCLEANKLILHTLCKPSFWAISISQ